MATRVVIVQHGDKVKNPGDPGLTDLGRAQAEQTAMALTRLVEPVAVLSSPLRRAVETATPLAEKFGLEVRVDARFRERMNWQNAHQMAFEEFLVEWEKASRDRTYRPRIGDSSRAAADRFVGALVEATAAHPGETLVVVSHGGVTTDALRTLLGDDELDRRAPGLIHDGVPSCAVTDLAWDERGWTVSGIADTSHFRPPR